MGLNHFYDEKENWRDESMSGFDSRSTGCSCCAKDLDTREEVEEEIINSLVEILKADQYFKFKINKLMDKAKAKRRKDFAIYRQELRDKRRQSHD